MYIYILYIPYSTKFSRRGSCNLKRFAETIFADQGNPVSHAFHLRLFAVPDQSMKNTKIIRLKFGAIRLYNVHLYNYIYNYMYYT